MQAPTNENYDELRVYKNGQLFLESVEIPNHDGETTSGYRYGYLLGWANSGFNDDTVLYIDNVKFFDVLAEPPSSTSNPSIVYQ